MAITENGYGKRTDFGEYRTQGRGGKGIISIQTTERNGKVVAGYAVKADESLMLITANGKMIRMPVDDFRVIGRATQGVRLINLEDGDTLVSAVTLDAEEDAPEDAEEGVAGDAEGSTEEAAEPETDTEEATE